MNALDQPNNSVHIITTRHFYHKITITLRRMVPVVLILFLAMQYLAQMYSIEHLLEDGVRDCVTCTLVQHFKHSILTATIPLAAPIIFDIVITTCVITISDANQTVFQSRAPPQYPHN